MNQIRLLIFVAFIAIIHQNCNASFSTEEYKKLYPDNDAICLKQSEEVKAEIINDKLVISGRNKMEFLCLSKLANKYNAQSLPFNQFIKIKNPSAAVYYPNNKSKDGYNVYRVTKFDVVDKLSENIFYSDSKEITFTLPSLIEGCKVVIEYDIEYKDPHLLTRYYFNNIMPVLQSGLKITSTSNIKIKALLFNTDPYNLKFDTIIEGNNSTVKISAENLNEYVFELGGPSISFTEPHAIASIQEYSINGVVTPVNDGVTGLYKWYYSLASEAFLDTNDAELKNLVTELKLNSSDKTILLSKIFEWVGKNIKYIAFEYGYAGFIPRLPSDVMKKRYGDCKDMAVLLYKLCSLSGIRCYPAWIGTNDLPYSYEENPTGYVDNHMIAIAEIDGKYYPLDATAQFLPYTIPSKMIQDKEALLAIDSEHYTIYKIPQVEASINLIQDSTTIEIINDGIRGHTKMILHGYSAFDFTSALMYSDKSNRDVMLKSMFQKVSNKFQIVDSSFTFSIINDVCIIDFDFLVDGCILSYENRMFINMNLGETFRSRMIDTTDRKTDFFLDNAIQFKACFTLKLPPGYQVSFLPPSRSVQKGKFHYEMKNSSNSSSITSIRNYTFDTIRISKNEMSVWNRWVEQIVNFNTENVILHK